MFRRLDRPRVLARACGIGGAALLVAAVLGAPSADANRRPADADEGGAIWARHCQACHGSQGGGDGPVAVDLVGGVPDLAGRFARRDVERAMPVVLQGKGAMPAFAEVLDAYQARRVLRHLAKIASEAAESPKPADPPEPSEPPEEP